MAAELFKHRWPTLVNETLGVYETLAGVTVADVNQDGIPDLVVGFGESLGSGKYEGGILILLGKGDGTFYWPSVL